MGLCLAGLILVFDDQDKTRTGFNLFDHAGLFGGACFFRSRAAFAAFLVKKKKKR